MGVMIIGLLAATARKRVIDVTDEAREASVEGVAGGFAAAVGLVRAQWEVEGRPSGNNGNGNGTVVTYDQTPVGVDGTIGYPTGSATGNTLITTVNETECKNVFDIILQSAQTNTTSTNDAVVADFRYAVREDDSGTNTQCVYYLVESMGLPNNTAPANGAPDGTAFDGFTYNPATGQVTVF
jgi:MSHA pilin protein MshB